MVDLPQISFENTVQSRFSDYFAKDPFSIYEILLKSLHLVRRCDGFLHRPKVSLNQECIVLSRHNC